MSVKREQIIQRYVQELELNQDQIAVFCCLVELIPTKDLASGFVYSDINKGMTIRATARKWGMTRWQISEISHRSPQD
jgi:hypothetical protein